jgi:hypothetical protein
VGPTATQIAVLTEAFHQPTSKLDELPPSGAGRPQLGGQVVDRSPSAAGEARPAALWSCIDVKARSFVVVKRATNLAVTTRAPTEEALDVDGGRDPKQGISSRSARPVTAPSTVDSGQIQRGRLSKDCRCVEPLRPEMQQRHRARRSVLVIPRRRRPEDPACVEARKVCPDRASQPEIRTFGLAWF